MPLIKRKKGKRLRKKKIKREVSLLALTNFQNCRKDNNFILFYFFLIVAYDSIDWHDFVIVETVEFTEADETIDLPPPMSIMELENMTLAQKKMASVNLVESQPDEKVGEIDME